MSILIMADSLCLLLVHNAAFSNTTSSNDVTAGRRKQESNGASTAAAWHQQPTLIASVAIDTDSLQMVVRHTRLTPADCLGC